MGNANCCFRSKRSNGEGEEQVLDEASVPVEMEEVLDEASVPVEMEEVVEASVPFPPELLMEEVVEASVPFPPELIMEEVLEEEVVEASVPLPLELIMEILSWLPVKPLARAQAVCREWRAQLQDHRFLQLHINRSSHTSYFYNDAPPAPAPAGARAGARADGRFYSFTLLHGCNGLLLLRNNTLRKHVVWNPAARLVLDLPRSPHTGNINYGLVLSFVPSTQKYKVVSFFEDDEDSRHGCRVVTLGRSMHWRRLAFPDLQNAHDPELRGGSLVPAGGAIHYCAAGGIVVSLDLETELITLNRLPPAIVRDAKATMIECDGKLGFAAIVREDLEVTVLEDYKNTRWCRNKKVIPLPFLKDEGFKGTNVVILFIKQGEIWLLSQNKHLYAYKIETAKIRYVQGGQMVPFPRELHVYKPSFVTLEGMLRADAGLDALLEPLKHIFE